MLREARLCSGTREEACRGWAEDGPAAAALGSRYQQEGVVALEVESPVVSRARILKPGYP